jgi:alpha-ketoglutarate-dependent taurine dioxygenase
MHRIYRDKGYVLLHPTAAYDVSQFVKFSRLLGRPILNSRTNDSGIFDIGVGKTPFVNEDVNETSYAEKHTDGLTFTASPDVSLLRCVRADSKGKGHNRIYDAIDTLIEFAKQSDEMMAALTKPVIEVFGGEKYRPILHLTPDTKQAKLYFNSDNIPNQPTYNVIRNIINDLPYDQVLLKPGDILVMNNARVLHGREKFDDDARHMQRIIIELDKGARFKLTSGFTIE